MARKTATPDETLPARRADWSQWSEDRERKRLAHDAEERRKAAETPIYPRELAAKIASDAAKTLIPDWQLLRSEHRGLFVQLLKQQPQLQVREVRQLDNLLRLIGDNLPSHLVVLLEDLRRILEFRLLAHEAAAFFVGTETGRRLERQYVDARGRTHVRHPRKADDGLRLHAGD